MQTALTKYTLSALAAFASFIYPLISLLLFTGFLIAVNVAASIWAAKKNKLEFDNEIKLNAWRKLIIFPLIIIISHWAAVLIPEVPFVKGATGILIIIEGNSLLKSSSLIIGVSLIQYVKNYISKGFSKSFTENDDKK